MFQCSNINQVKLLSERTSGAPPVIFKFNLESIKLWLKSWDADHVWLEFLTTWISLWCPSWTYSGIIRNSFLWEFLMDASGSSLIPLCTFALCNSSMCFSGKIWQQTSQEILNTRSPWYTGESYDNFVSITCTCAHLPCINDYLKGRPYIASLNTLPSLSENFWSRSTFRFYFYTFIPYSSVNLQIARVGHWGRSLRFSDRGGG